MKNTALELFYSDVQEFVGPNLKLRPADLEVLAWLFNQKTSVYLFIKKNCPYRMPENWRHWYENGMEAA